MLTSPTLFSAYTNGQLTGVQLAVGALYGSVLGGPFGASASSCNQEKKMLTMIELSNNTLPK